MVSQARREERSRDMSNMSVTEIMMELKEICEQVLSGDRKIDNSFFTTKPEASKLKETCVIEDVAEVLSQLRTFRGEPNPAPYIQRLEEYQAATAELAQAPVTAKPKPLPAAKSSDTQIIFVPMKEISPHPEVDGLYPIDPHLLESIADSMKDDGFDSRFPIQLVKGDEGYLAWDGLTRLKAALMANVETVPAIVSKFKSDSELIESVIGNQNRRRSCNNQVILVSVEKLTAIAAERAKSNQGRRTDLTSDQNCSEVEGERANEYIARLIGKSRTTVTQAKAILKDDGLKLQVLSETLSISKAYEMLREKQKPGSVDSAKASRHVKNVAAQKEEPAEAAPGGDKPVDRMITVPVAMLELLFRHYPAHHAGELELTIAGFDPEIYRIYHVSRFGVEPGERRLP